MMVGPIFSKQDIMHGAERSLRRPAFETAFGTKSRHKPFAGFDTGLQYGDVIKIHMVGIGFGFSRVGVTVKNAGGAIFVRSERAGLKHALLVASEAVWAGGPYDTRICTYDHLDVPSTKAEDGLLRLIGNDHTILIKMVGGKVTTEIRDRDNNIVLPVVHGDDFASAYRILCRVINAKGSESQ